MKYATTVAALALWLIIQPNTAQSQFAEITLIPNQNDQAESMGGGQIVEAANGDLVAFLIEFGEWTDINNFPWIGTPANLWATRSADGGDSWSAPLILKTGITLYGTQGIASVLAVVQESGRIVINYYYQLDTFPNYAKTSETLHSDDNGVTWTKTSDKDSDGYSMANNDDGDIVTVDAVNDTELWTRVSTDGGATWSAGNFALDLQFVCGQHISIEPDTGTWVLIYSECGANVSTRRIKSTDGGVTWSAPEVLFQSDSLFGVDASLVHGAGGNQWLIYREGGAIVFRASADAGATWSGSTVWSAGTNENAKWDLSPRCSMSTRGPICLFYSRTDRPNFVAYIGIPGVSVDPRFAPVSIEEDQTLAEAFALDQNYPNPFNPQTRIAYTIKKASKVQLSVYDIMGREVQQLVHEHVPAGAYETSFDGSGLASGLYIYRLTANGVTKSKTMSLLK